MRDPRNIFFVRSILNLLLKEMECLHVYRSIKTPLPQKHRSTQFLTNIWTSYENHKWRKSSTKILWCSTILKYILFFRFCLGNHNSFDGWVGLALYELVSLFGWEEIVQMQAERSNADKWGNYPRNAYVCLLCITFYKLDRLDLLKFF